MDNSVFALFLFLWQTANAMPSQIAHELDDNFFVPLSEAQPRFPGVRPAPLPSLNEIDSAVSKGTNKQTIL